MVKILVITQPPFYSNAGMTCADLDSVAAQYRLSPREHATVEYLLQGLTTKVIAGHMGISPSTVKTSL